MTDEIRIEVRIKNNLLYEAIIPVFGSVAEFSRRSGIGQQFVGDLINLKTSPFSMQIARDSRRERSMERHLIASRQMHRKIGAVRATARAHGWSKRKFETIRKCERKSRAHEHAAKQMEETTRRGLEGIYLPSAQKLAEICGYSCEDLFPIDLYQNVTKSMVVKTIGLHKLLFMKEQKLIADGIVHEVIDDVSALRKRQVGQTLLSDLSQTQRDVIEQRFGIGGKIEKTLQQVAEKIGVSLGRVRQIEDNAIRRLRRPRRPTGLMDYA